MAVLRACRALPARGSRASTSGCRRALRCDPWWQRTICTGALDSLSCGRRRERGWSRRRCRRGGDGGASDSRDFASLGMAELVAEMELAAMSEQFSQAKLMQDEYRRRVATAVGQVEEINMKFYKAFSMGDINEMKQVRGDYEMK